VAGLHTALTFIFTAQGIPCVYYGTEQEFSGGNDPGNREDLWPTGFKEDGRTYTFIQKLTAIRRASAAIRKGDVKVVWSTDRTGNAEDAGIFAFERMGGDAGSDYALVVLNANQTGPSAPTFQGTPMTVDLPEGTVLTDALGSPATYTVGPQGRLAIDPLAPQTALVLLKQ
jgi:alpha-amylase